MNFKIFRFWFMILFIVSCALDLYALDVNLRNLPMPSETNIVWRDSPLQINGINASGTHLYSQLPVEEVLDFYKGIFLKEGWQIKDHFKDQYVIVFIRDNRFMYVAGRSHSQEGTPCDVYLVSSYSDLAICKILTKHMENQKGMIMQEDAAGRDISDIPRYPGSKRMVSISAPEQGNILIYQTIATPQQVANFYQSHLKTSGWQLAQALKPEFLKNRALKSENVKVLLFQKGNETLFINASLLPREVTDQEISMITIVKNMLEEFAAPSGIKER